MCSITDPFSSSTEFDVLKKCCLWVPYDDKEDQMQNCYAKTYLVALPLFGLTGIFFGLSIAGYLKGRIKELKINLFRTAFFATLLFLKILWIKYECAESDSKPSVPSSLATYPVKIRYRAFSS